MKSGLLYTLLFLLSASAYAQNDLDKKIYLDSLWHETSESNHRFYRIVENYYAEKATYKITDYYKSGAINMQGMSTSKDYMREDGEVTYYYENGNKESIKNYDKGWLSGKVTKWYNNGKPKMTGKYLKLDNGKSFNSELKIYDFWDADQVQKVVNGNGDYEEDTKEETNKGKIKNGSKDGIWVGSNKSIKFTYSEKYEHGELVSGTSIDADQVEHQYTSVEIKPEPKKGIEDFYKHVMKNFVTPNDPKVGGRILVGFVIDKDGSPIDVKIIKGIGHGPDEEAIRIVSIYKNWSPGILRGNKVKVSYTIPITIRPME